MSVSPANLPDDALLLVDACGLRCPLPLLKLRQTLRRLPSGSLLRLRVTDPASQQDIPNWLRQSPHQLVQHKLIQQQPQGEITEFIVRSGEMNEC